MTHDYSGAGFSLEKQTFEVSRLCNWCRVLYTGAALHLNLGTTQSSPLLIDRAYLETRQACSNSDRLIDADCEFPAHPEIKAATLPDGASAAPFVGRGGARIYIYIYIYYFFFFKVFRVPIHSRELF